MPAILSQGSDIFAELARPVLRMAAVDLVPEAAQVAVARRLVRAAVREWGLEALADDCVLAVSELVTSAISAAAGITGPDGGPARVRLRVTALDSPPGVLTEVWDASPDLPCRVEAGPDSLGGRGLAIVAALAARHGVERAGSGKRVWAEITLERGQTD